MFLVSWPKKLRPERSRCLETSNKTEAAVRRCRLPSFLGFALGGWDLSDVDLGHGWKGKTHNPESFMGPWIKPLVFFTTYSQSWDDPPKWLTLHFDP